MTAVEPFAQPSRLSGRRAAKAPTDIPDNVRLLEPRRGPAHTAVERADSLGRIRAWMVVPPVDFLMLAAPALWIPHLYTIGALAVVGTFILSGGVRYRAPLHLSLLDELPTISTRLLTSTAVIGAVLLVAGKEDPLVSFLQIACISMGLVIAGRFVTTRLTMYARCRDIASYNTILIGGGPMAAELARILSEHRMYGLRVAGYVDDGDELPAAQYLPHLGTLADLDLAVMTTGTNTLLVADGGFEENALTNAVRTNVCQSANLLVVPRMPYFHALTGGSDHIGSIPVMRIRNPNLRGLASFVKRAFDIVVALAAFIIVSPLMSVAALAVRMEGGPGIIFRQVRVGQDGKHFELLKFRTMRPANEQESQTLWCVATDNRVGPVGRFLRSTSVDELPQLWNILRGDMTLVGPRPERPHFVEQFSTQFDRYAHRHRVQVGLTGFAQVSGLRGDTSIADRARYDNFYIENWSLWLDIKIILRTFREVLFRRGR